jgi:hypothetical protein
VSGPPRAGSDPVTTRDAFAEGATTRGSKTEPEPSVGQPGLAVGQLGQGRFKRPVTQDDAYHEGRARSIKADPLRSAPRRDGERPVGENYPFHAL